MATYQKFHCFVEHAATKVHNLASDALTVALVAAANAPSLSGHTVLADLTQASYTNCSSRVLSVTSAAQSGGVMKVVVDDLTLAASGGAVGPFRYVVVYNDTPTSPADPLVCMFDYGSDLTLNAGESILLDFDQVNGLLSIQ